MSKQTSIEWLIDQMFKQGYFDGNTPLSITNLDHLQYQAKQMHKEEIIKSRENGISEGYRRTNNFYYDKMVDSDTYFEKTYGSKGSDYHIVDTNEMIDHIGDANKMVEISDEEIEQYAKQNAFNYYEFITGAKWYREQLNKKEL